MIPSGVLVTGGAGVLGSQVAERLRRAHVGTRAMSRGQKPGTVRGDLISGAGLEPALRGVDTVIHCASSPFHRTHETDVGGTRRLMRAAAGAGVGHVVFISIVGIDRVRSYPYYRAKLEAERVVGGGEIPHTILRATQFYDLVLTAIRALDRLPAMPIPRGMLGQPVDSGEVADRLVELALAGPAGRVPDVGGPEVLTLADMARGYLQAVGRHKRVLEFALPGKTARAVRSGALTCPDNAHGEVRWEGFLRRKFGGRGGPSRVRAAG